MKITKDNMKIGMRVICIRPPYGLEDHKNKIGNITWFDNYSFNLKWDYERGCENGWSQNWEAFDLYIPDDMS